MLCEWLSTPWTQVRNQGGGGNDNDLHKTLKKTWIIAPQADAGHALA